MFTSSSRRYALIVPISVALLSALAIAPSAATSTTATSLSTPMAESGSILDPTGTYAGKTYAEWSASWWKWALRISEPRSPVTDPTGADCAVRQDTRVWFLAGNTGGTTTRSCTVPANRAILFPVINAACWAPNDGETEAELKACAATLMDAVTETTASIDGASVDLGPPSDGRFRFVSRLFTLKIAPDNGFGAPSGKTRAVADGFWVLVNPLPVGQHTIEFHGSAPAFGFELSVHYDLTVV